MSVRIDRISFSSSSDEDGRGSSDSRQYRTTVAASAVEKTSSFFNSSIQVIDQADNRHLDNFDSSDSDNAERTSNFNEDDPRSGVHNEETNTSDVGLCAEDLLFAFHIDEYRSCGFSNLFKQTRGHTYRRYIIHDIWYPRQYTDFRNFSEDVLSKVHGFCRRDGFYVCFEHRTETPHIHFVHDCAYSNKSCRCNNICTITEKYRKTFILNIRLNIIDDSSDEELNLPLQSTLKTFNVIQHWKDAQGLASR